MKCSLGISDFLEESSSLSHAVGFLCFSALITEEGLISPCCYFRPQQICASLLSALSTRAGRCGPVRPQETLRPSKAGLVPSLVDSLLLSLGPDMHKVLFCPPRVCFPSPVEVL